MLFERSSFAGLCKARLNQLREELVHLREAWTDAARKSSIQSRQLNKNPTRPGYRKRERDKRSAEQQKADAAKQQAEGIRAQRGTAELQRQLQDREARSKGAVAGQRAEFATDHAKQQAAAAAEAKAKAAADKKKSSGAAGAEKKAVAAEHDAKIKPMASELAALAAAGQRGSPEYAQKYAAYKAATEAKKLALGGTASVPAPDKGKPAAGSTRAPRTARRAQVKVGKGTRVPRGR